MIAYLDLPSGLSGDMFLGCLVDAGWGTDRLHQVAKALAIPEDEWLITVDQVSKAGFRATQVTVDALEGRHQRGLGEVRRMIESAELPLAVRDRSIAVFNRLAQAEAKVHGTTPERVHFHEVGAVDALIDIVGVVTGLHELEIESVYASAVPLGSGWAKSAHGDIPLPAPATLELLAGVCAPTRPAPGPGEWVTPTGAALLAELAIFQQPAITIAKIAVGAGQRESAWANVARMWIGQASGNASDAASDKASDRGAMVQLETNIDDMNPQLYGAVSEKLFAAGAKDVWLTPIQMKKNRPAILLSVLGFSAHEDRLIDVLLRETTTLGVRVHPVDHRREARREMRTVDTSFGAVRVKVKWVENEPIGATPEFDDCRAAAEAAGVPVRLVIDAAAAVAQDLLQSLRTNAQAGSAMTPAAASS